MRDSVSSSWKRTVSLIESLSPMLPSVSHVKMFKPQSTSRPLDDVQAETLYSPSWPFLNANLYLISVRLRVISFSLCSLANASSIHLQSAREQGDPPNRLGGRRERERERDGKTDGRISERVRALVLDPRFVDVCGIVLIAALSSVHRPPD